MTILLTCKRCKGTGTIANERFRIYSALKSDEVKRHFQVHAKAERLESDGDEGPMMAECGESPEIECPQCNGEGVLEFDEEGWEITMVPPDDDDPGDKG